MRYIFYDTETTGRSPQNDRIVEIAAYDPLNNTTFEQLINPKMAIPKEAIEIHHITDDMVQDAPVFLDVAEAFIEFTKGEVLLVAHNNFAFDKPLLEAEFRRNDLKIPENWIFFDSLIWARVYRPDLPRHALQYLRQIYGIPENNAHRALDDVIVLSRVMQYMTDDLDPETAYHLISHRQPKESAKKQKELEPLSLFSYQNSQ